MANGKASVSALENDKNILGNRKYSKNIIISRNEAGQKQETGKNTT